MNLPAVAWFRFLTERVILSVAVSQAERTISRSTSGQAKLHYYSIYRSGVTS
jgi:hypothetical protein